MANCIYVHIILILTIQLISGLKDTLPNETKSIPTYVTLYSNNFPLYAHKITTVPLRSYCANDSLCQCSKISGGALVCHFSENHSLFKRN